MCVVCVFVCVVLYVNGFYGVCGVSVRLVCVCVCVWCVCFYVCGKYMVCV